MKESRVERHMSQHNMTTQMEGGARETLGKRVSNHEMRSEGNLQLHAAGIVQLGKNNDLSAICGAQDRPGDAGKIVLEDISSHSLAHLLQKTQIKLPSVQPGYDPQILYSRRL